MRSKLRLYHSAGTSTAPTIRYISYHIIIILIIVSSYIYHTRIIHQIKGEIDPQRRPLHQQHYQEGARHHWTTNDRGNFISIFIVINFVIIRFQTPVAVSSSMSSNISTIDRKPLIYISCKGAKTSGNKSKILLFFSSAVLRSNLQMDSTLGSLDLICP